MSALPHEENPSSVLGGFCPGEGGTLLMKPWRRGIEVGKGGEKRGSDEVLDVKVGRMRTVN